MKKILFFSLLVCLPLLAFAQESASTYESTHYMVTSFVSAENAQASAERLEAYLGVFNDVFHFDLDRIPLKLKVKVFNGKARYDQYVQRLINETRDDFVYLHYSNPARSELVGYIDSDKEASEAGIVHQAFVQYLRSFVANPPLWMREGFAVYFESTKYEAGTKTAMLNENLAWLETFKTQVFSSSSTDVIPLEKLLQYGVDEAKTSIKTFYPQAWGLVHYLANTLDRDHNRILWDALHALKTEAALDDNSLAVSEKAFGWEGFSSLTEGMQKYYQTKKTFPEMVQTGIDAYNNGKVKDAEDVFSKSLDSNTASFVPYYYLGLINYDNGAYAKAEEYYTVALEKGANAALTNYALGVNAFADNRFESATVFLKDCLKLDDNYKEKVGELVKRMELETGAASTAAAPSASPAPSAVPSSAPAASTAPAETPASTVPAASAAPVASPAASANPSAAPGK